MNVLFSDDALNRPRREIAPGAVWIPGWLTPEQQRWIVDRFREWAAGPVPPRPAKIRGHEMSVQTVCLGWHWRPYAYTRDAVDVNGRRVLDMPDWMTKAARHAVADAFTDPDAAERYRPDAALVNYYDRDARMGMHQDKDEQALAPVVSLSIGDTCRFRFGNTETRNGPYDEIDLASGDLFVFGGPSRLAFHGVTGIRPRTAPPSCGLDEGRINITIRETGLT